MVKHRHVSILTCAAVIALLLTQFQNCGPAGVQSLQAGPGAGGEVRIIDDWNKTEIQFFAPEVQVHDEAATSTLDGLCNRSHNGARLRWTLWVGQQTEAPLFSGQSVCASGAFNVQLRDLEDMVCGVKHLLVVEGDWGGSTFTHVLRRCQPLAMEPMAVPPDAPAGTHCALEYQVADEQPCSQVCYRSDKVVLSRALLSSQCSGLAAKLAGP